MMRGECQLQCDIFGFVSFTLVEKLFATKVNLVNRLTKRFDHAETLILGVIWGGESESATSFVIG